VLYPIPCAGSLIIGMAASLALKTVLRSHVFMRLNVPCHDCRYDLLCLEGLARALRVFNATEPIPVYKVASVPRDSMLKMHVKPQVMSGVARRILTCFYPC
jgi:hypothetical protein